MSETDTLSCGHPWSERAGGPLSWYCRTCVSEANQRDWLTAAEAAFEVLDDAIPWEVGQIQLHAYRVASDARTANDFLDALRAWFLDRGEHWICGVFPDHWHVSEPEAQACIVRYISPHERAGFLARREEAAP